MNDLENNNLLQQNNQNNQNNQNKTCCHFMKTHPLKISLFIIQVVLSFGLVGFSLFQIVRDDLPDETDKSVYFSMVSGLVGYWLPSPKSKLKK